MKSINPTDKQKQSESDSSDTNNASSSKNKEAEIRGKDNETETDTDNTVQETQIKDHGLSGDTEHVQKEKDDLMPTQQTCSSEFQQNKQDQIVEHTVKTANVSHTGKKENAKHDSKSDNRKEMTKLIPSAPQMETETGKQVNKKSPSKSGVSSSGDSQVKVDDDDAKSSDSTTVDTEVDGNTPNARHPGRKEDDKQDSKSEMTKLIPSAPQMETETGKQVNKKSPSKSGVSSSGDSQVKVDDESSPHPTYSGFPQQRPQQIREGTDNNLPWIGIVVVLVSVVCGYYLHVSGSTLNKIPKQLDMVEVFNQEMEKLQSIFPSQRPELWKRSVIHIRRHLKTEHPTEPVSLILTSGRRAEKTLGCLAQCLAQAFSTARNSTFLNIDGKAKTSLDSDQVKLDIDSELTKAFESEKFAAVIHRFEELPPGSTLIFYRYCDHENAAYKNVFLAFTVMLDAEAEVLSNINLGKIEEMVQDHVKQKFVSSDKSAVFNQMDVDKLSGLWSRISHLILPVVTEERIEQHGCRVCDKPF